MEHVPWNSKPGNPFVSWGEWGSGGSGGGFPGRKWAEGDPVPSPLCPLQDDKEYVGFATLPNQVHRKSVKKGFDFTLMVAGTGVQLAWGC